MKQKKEAEKGADGKMIGKKEKLNHTKSILQPLRKRKRKRIATKYDARMWDLITKNNTQKGNNTNVKQIKRNHQKPPTSSGDKRHLKITHTHHNVCSNFGL